MSDADCTPGREPRSVAASLETYFHTIEEHRSTRKSFTQHYNESFDHESQCRSYSWGRGGNCLFCFVPHEAKEAKTFRGMQCQVRQNLRRYWFWNLQRRKIDKTVLQADMNTLVIEAMCLM